MFLLIIIIYSGSAGRLPAGPGHRQQHRHRAAAPSQPAPLQLHRRRPHAGRVLHRRLHARGDQAPARAAAKADAAGRIRRSLRAADGRAGAGPGHQARRRPLPGAPLSLLPPVAGRQHDSVRAGAARPLPPHHPRHISGRVHCKCGDPGPPASQGRDGRAAHFQAGAE
eukprot:jgi/Mesen1/2186/ME000152S01280